MKSSQKAHSIHNRTSDQRPFVLSGPDMRDDAREKRNQERSLASPWNTEWIALIFSMIEKCRKAFRAYSRATPNKIGSKEV